MATLVVVNIMLISTIKLTSCSVWFGHVLVSSYYTKFFIVMSVIFLFCVLFSGNSYYTTREPYDYYITQINVFYWSSLIFAANSLVSMIFIIEVQSALLFLIVVTSTFSSSHFYNNSDLSDFNSFSNQTPYSFVNSIMFFFWVSLLTSLNLFLFTTTSYQKLLTFDWYLIEHIFGFLTESATPYDVSTLCLYWFIFLFSLFTKSGIAPFFIWKPTFFKGISMNLLMFYIIFFYYSIFIYFIYFLNGLMHSILFYYSFLLTSIIMSSIFVILSVILEASYLKTFLAMSSILNSTLVLLAISSPCLSDVNVFL